MGGQSNSQAVGGGRGGYANMLMIYPPSATCCQCGGAREKKKYPGECTLFFFSFSFFVVYKSVCHLPWSHCHRWEVCEHVSLFDATHCTTKREGTCRFLLSRESPRSLWPLTDIGGFLSGVQSTFADCRGGRIRYTQVDFCLCLIFRHYRSDITVHLCYLSRLPNSRPWVP